MPGERRPNLRVTPNVPPVRGVARPPGPGDRPHARRAEREQPPRACPACLSPLWDARSDYCPRCTTPVSLASTFDPLKIIRTEGELFRRGARRPSGVAVVGMWMLFGPAAVGSIALAAIIGKFSIVLLSPLFWLYGAILYRVTTRYSAMRHEPPGDGPHGLISAGAKP